MLIYIKVIFTIINSFILKFKLKKILQNKRAYPLEIQIKKILQNKRVYIL